MNRSCERAFEAYDGLSYTESAFRIVIIGVDKADWEEGIRSVQCIAYEPGGPVDYSIKGSHK